MTALDFVLELASVNDACLISTNKHLCQAVIDLKITRSDAHRVVYRLLLIAKDHVVSAQELTPEKLPTFCPQLHINSNGTFCLGWEGEINTQITDKESAQRWWLRLHNFLRLQQRATKLKAWPSKQWAHGQAAIYQQKAEQIAKLLGQDFVEDIENSSFQTHILKRTHKHMPLLGLYRKNHLTYVVSINNQKVLNKQQACICMHGDIKRHRRLKSCSNHAELGAAFAISLYEWQKKEQEFWESFKGHKCCGLMSGCQLRD